MDSSVNQIPESRKTDCDQLSNFPDSVLSHVFSFLPTKDAVRTSVLSKAWEYKWTLKYNIQLDDYMTFGRKGIDKEAFPNFIDRTLVRSQHLQTFSLSVYGTYDSTRIKTWVSAALNRNVHDLFVLYRQGGQALPSNLLSCSFLRKLKLYLISSTLNVSDKICFPYLTDLMLGAVEISNENFDSNVVKFSFPVLETLSLSRCKWLNVEVVEICAPKLTSFSSRTSDDAGVSDYSFHITGGSLVKLATYGGLPENIILSGGSQVVSASLHGACGEEDLDCLADGGILIRELMNTFLSLEELEISHLVAEALAVSKPTLSLPKYNKMARLVIYRFSNARVLLELLHAAPFLKSLLFYYMSDLEDYDYDAEEYVPSCIITHLEEVKFWGGTGETKFAKFILKNAVKLKTMQVSGNQIAEELSRYPRASTCVTISDPSTIARSGIPKALV